VVLASQQRALRPKHKTLLLLCLGLAIFEFIVWLSIGAFASWTADNFRIELISYTANGFGEITIALATTFYVVFTYGMLANSEAQRRHSTEPHLVKRWRQDPESTAYQLTKTALFADRARSLLADVAALRADAIDDADMATGNRYLILELSNVRQTPVGWLKLSVSGQLTFPHHAKPIPLDDELFLKDLHISREDKIEVTVVDLFPIPQTAELTLNVDALAYGAIDGGEVLDESSGGSEKTVVGEFIPQLRGPQPDLETSSDGEIDAQ